MFNVLLVLFLSSYTQIALIQYNIKCLVIEAVLQQEDKGNQYS